MSLISGFLFITLISWTMFRAWALTNDLKKFFLPALIFKCTAGVVLGLIYSFYYRSGDTLEFFANSQKLVTLAQTDLYSYFNFLVKSEFVNGNTAALTFGDPRAVFMVKIVSLISFVSFHNYWVIGFYCSLFSFFSSWYLVVKIRHFFYDATPAAIIAFLFFPSIVFWSSGLIKEAFAMAGLYYISGVFISVWFTKRINIGTMLLAIVAAFILWKLKYYFAGIFLAVIAASLLYRVGEIRLQKLSHGFFGVLGWLAVLLILFAGVTFLHPNFRPHRLLVVLVENNNAFNLYSKPENLISFKALEPTFSSIAWHSPKALVSGLFRPFISEADNVLSVMISIENLILLLLTIVALRHLPKIFASNVRVLLMAIVVYVILLAIFITLSTPNFGTLARYRVGYLPFFVFLILLAPPISIRLQRVFSRIARVD